MGQFAIVPARALDDTRINEEDLRALLILGTYADTQGWCWPSLATIAKRLDCSRTGAFNVMHYLEDCGYIQIVSAKNPDGGNSSNRYRILFDAELPAQYDKSVLGQDAPSKHPVQEPPKEIEQGVKKSLGNSETKVPENAPVYCSADAEQSKPLKYNLPHSITNGNDNDLKKREPIPPRTPLARYLAENAVYGKYHWDGFRTVGQRSEWEDLEKQNSEGMKRAVDWAIKKNFSKSVLVDRIVTATYHQKITPKKPQRMRVSI